MHRVNRTHNVMRNAQQELFKERRGSLVRLDQVAPILSRRNGGVFVAAHD